MGVIIAMASETLQILFQSFIAAFLASLFNGTLMSYFSQDFEHFWNMQPLMTSIMWLVMFFGFGGTENKSPLSVFLFVVFFLFCAYFSTFFL